MKIALICLVIVGYACADVGSFRKAAYAKHNEYRKVHGVPNAKADSKAEGVAQKWAEHLASTGKFEHNSGRGNFGENIYWSSRKSGITGDAAVKNWYDEIKDYNFNSPGFNGKTGHFTQVVWKKSTGVGCGMASSDHGTYVVCDYSPPGNYGNQYKIGRAHV